MGQFPKARRQLHMRRRIIDAVPILRDLRRLKRPLAASLGERAIARQLQELDESEGDEPEDDPDPGERAAA